jgi:hypothetical protein
MLHQANCKNTLIVIGADKGGVGKTTLSRLVLDYLAALGVSVRAFDTEPGDGVLKRFFPSAVTVNLADSADQSFIIDKLADARVTLVDVRAGLLSPTLHLFQRIGFKHGEEAHLAVLHVLGNSIASISEIKNTAAMLRAGGDHVLVKNHANAGKFFEWDDTAQADYLKPVNASALIEIGNLDALATERADKSNQTFAAFAADPANSRVLRGLVRAWEADSHAAFDRIGLKNLAA